MFWFYIGVDFFRFASGPRKKGNLWQYFVGGFIFRVTVSCAESLDLAPNVVYDDSYG